MLTLVKQPGETLDVAPAFATGAPIVSAPAPVVTARGLVAGAAPLLASIAVGGGEPLLTLSGGSDGERYLVTATATDPAGELLQADIEVAVIEAAWSLPGGGAPYLSIADFIQGFGLEEVVRMTDADGSGRIDRAQLTRALADAQAIVDAHLAGRYQLPLAAVPAIIALAVADLARARLYPRGAPVGVDDAAKTALAFLLRIQSGAMLLDVAGVAPTAAQLPANEILISPGRTRYTDAWGERY